MRSAIATAVATSIWLTTITAQNGIVQWNIEKKHLKPQLSRRAEGVFEEVITNEKTRGGYFSTVKIGTPPQDLTLQLDTGSSDTWVPSSIARVCTSIISEGCTFGSFDTAESTSFQDVRQDEFSIAYVDGSFSKGDYFTDTLEIGGAVINNLTMGLGRNTTIAYGLVGVGYASNVASLQTTDTAYPNLPVTMMNDGLINTVAYSLWLNDLGSNTGNILFGGIDTEKYVGSLTRIRILKDEGAENFTHFTVPLTSVEATSSSGSDSLSSSRYPIPVVLDSGTTLSYLPTDLVSQIWQEVGAYWVNSIGLAVLPCSRANAPGNFTFGLAGPDGPRISLGMDELVVDLTAGQPPTFADGKYEGQLVCEFGIQNFSSPPYILGDTFLRSAYVVYDLLNNEIGIAATDFNATETNFVAFPSSGAPIPSATAAPNQDQIEGTVATPGFDAAPGFQNPGSLLNVVSWSSLVALVGPVMVYQARHVF